MFRSQFTDSDMPERLPYALENMVVVFNCRGGMMLLSMVFPPVDIKIGNRHSTIGGYLPSRHVSGKLNIQLLGFRNIGGSDGFPVNDLLPERVASCGHTQAVLVVAPRFDF